MVDINPHWKSSPKFFGSFAKVCTTIFDTISVFMNMQNEEQGKIIRECKEYITSFSTEADGVDRLVKRYCDGEARLQKKASGGKKRKRTPQPYEYGDIKKKMKDNPLVKLLVFVVIYYKTSNWVHDECVRRMDAYISSDFWNQDANDENAEKWEARANALAEHEAQEFLETIYFHFQNGLNGFDQFMEDLNQYEDAGIQLDTDF